MADTAPGKEVPQDDELLDVLKESVQEVFSMMCCSIEEAGLERGGSEPSSGTGTSTESAFDVEAVIGFEGRVDGFIVLRCSSKSALDVANGLLMTEGDMPFEEISDALGECVNMVAGSLKTKALDPVDEFKLGLPEIHREEAEKRDYRCGSLAYRLSDDMIAAELWMARREDEK